MKIKIAQFEGPLDLLLRLIEEQKLEIKEISLAAVTDHFLEYMRGQTALSPQELADWLVIAAKLLVIKSRALLPALALAPEEQEDAANLTWQIYQYKRFKEAARALRALERQNLQSWGRHTAFVEKISFYPDVSLAPSALQAAMKYLAKTLEEIIKIPKKILEEVVTISDKIGHLQQIIRQKVELKLRDLLSQTKSKTEIIVTFLALLELVKQKILSADQEAMFSDIIIKKKI